MELAAGTVVDRYVVEGVLGEGGMAIVYLVRHTQLGTKHALKLLTISSRAVRERLVQEGRVQASLRHPNIVTVTDIIVVNGAPGLVMEYIDGPSLDDLLDQKRLTYAQVDHLVEGLLRGVAHAHSKGLVHRDLKPANIMLAVEDGVLVPKVTDFGLAKLLQVDDGRTRTGSTMGTPQYMSPEQVSDSKNVDHRTDVFACGAILYEMVTGHRAFGGDSLFQIFGAVTEGQYRNPRELRPDLPDRMVEAILGALIPDKDERIQTIEDLLAVWKGEKTHGGAPKSAVMAAPATAFPEDFLEEVRSLTAEAIPSRPPEGPYGGPDTVSVESLYTTDDSSPAADLPPVGAGGKDGSAHPSAATASPPVVATPSAPEEVSPEARRGVGMVVVGLALVVLLGGGAILLMGIGGVALYWMRDEQPDLVVVESPPGLPAPVAPRPVSTTAGAAPAPAAPRPAPRPAPHSAADGSVAGPTRTAPAPSPEPPSGSVAAPSVDTDASPGGGGTDASPGGGGTDVEAGGVDDWVGIASSDPDVRMATIEANWSEPALTDRFVRIAREDPNRDVQIRAWQAVIRQYKAGIGNRRLQEGLIVEAIDTGSFSRTEAVAAYGRIGEDPQVALRAYQKGKLRAKEASIRALVAIGRRTGNPEAKAILQRLYQKARGPMRWRLELAIGEL